MVDDPKQGGEELKHETPKPKGPLAEREEEVLNFWNSNSTFEDSLTKEAPKGEYIFYDGPPFANGLPHYGHILASTIKDAIPRYQTMRGHRVLRQWGWDCHGLPVENLVEKELGFKTKRDIEQYGIAKFNEAARASIMKDVADWKRIIPRLGRWADMEHDYKTMDATYTESVWWAFKTLYDRGLIYEGFKSMHLCPRCGTTLSNFEVAQGYKDIEDFAVTVKLPLVDEPNTSLLIWTTTPWTLPGNAAAAVNPDATYVKVKTENGNAILVKDRVSAVLGEGANIIAEIKGKDLIGKSYVPPFPYFKDELHKHKTHAWKVYGGAFVSLEDGTGIVHIAPAFGEDDLNLSQKEKIPLIQHVTEEGKFISTVADFAGLSVKPKGNPKETDAKIVEWLKEKGLLFKQEFSTHAYPHCWRCDTPLLNWAANSWFVKVSAIKDKLLKENEKITWIPDHIGSARFKNGIESAPDWAISRSRYWGAPLPVWKNSKTKEIKVAGSVDDLFSMARKSGNTYFVMRHGQADNNVKRLLNADNSVPSHLSEEGKQQVEKRAKDFQKEGIDLLVISPLIRAQETARIVQKVLQLPDGAVMTDERLREVQFGAFNNKPIAAWHESFQNGLEYFTKSNSVGENYADVRRRVGEFLFEIEKRYAGKKILIVTHDTPAWLIDTVARMRTNAEIAEGAKDSFLQKGEIRQVPFVPYPHNPNYELDLHRPYIDEIPLGDSVKGEWERVAGVFDCWFESGAMPFGSKHYPFEKKLFDPKRFFGFGSKGYPADFIAEGLDQTRGWFYSLIVLGTALFGKSPYKHVIVNGLVLASDGQKMSKRLRNYPDPMEVVEKYGADSLRYYLLSSSVIRAEDLRFNERGVEEISKKLIMRLDNVYSFYKLYATSAPIVHYLQSPHVLDRWIMSRLGELVRETTEGFEKYELDAATRPLAQFIDDLSTWYVRRSRDRFKEEGEDKQFALATLRYVLYTTAHVMAPVMPFFADYLFRNLRDEDDEESVHLMNWPEPLSVDEILLTEMELARTVSSQGLQAREKAGIKIRQPLSTLTVKTLPMNPEIQQLIKDELNVKNIAENKVMEAEVELDVTITPELKEEGLMRDIIRRIQEWRKQENLTIGDRPSYTLVVTEEEKPVAEKYKTEIAAKAGLASLTISVS